MSSLVIIYIMVFIIGPVGYLRLLRPKPAKRQFVGLGCLVAGATGMSFALRYFSGGWGQGVFTTFVGIGFIWLAWIAILAFVAQSLRQRDRGPTMRRWTAVLGALATTIPWFGLASARMMTF